MIYMKIRRISGESISRAAQRIYNFDNNAVFGFWIIINIVSILYVRGNHGGRFSEFQAVAKMYRLQIQTIITQIKL